LQNEGVRLKLKEYCEKEGITMSSIAKSLNYSVIGFLHAVNGSQKMSYKRAKEVSEYCDGEVTVDDLIPYKKPERCSHCKSVNCCLKKHK
jgi:hypothetical protein